MTIDRDCGDVPAVGTTLGAGRFELERCLGRGGFGVVYRAHDRERGAPVALKLMTRNDARALYRFKQEFRALAELEHPNLIRLYELHTDGDRWFFTMELLDAVDARAYVQPSRDAGNASGSTSGRPAATTRFDEPRLRALLCQLTAGLGFLHRASHLHRDINPARERFRWWPAQVTVPSATKEI